MSYYDIQSDTTPTGITVSRSKSISVDVHEATDTVEFFNERNEALFELSFEQFTVLVLRINRQINLIERTR